jgi:beta-lactamase regulating signal transducer with metallopeptidase domain
MDISGLFLKILNMSITAAYAALAVMLVRLALKKAPKAVSFALWIVVLFRLVCPVSFSSAFSLMRIGSVAPARTGSSITYIQSPAPVLHAPAASSAAAPAASAAADITPAVPASAAPEADPVQMLLAVAAVVWAAGVAVMLAASAVSHIRLKRRISDATLLSGNVYETDAISSPFVLGIIRPRIYLPACIDKADLDYVLRHERMHIKRKDNVIKPLAWAALCMHWFNPLVWAAFRLMCCDMEMSCDERVLRGMDEREKAGYGEALLRLSKSRSLFAASPLAFGESAVGSRIKNVLKFKKPALWIAAVAAVAAIVTGVCLIANPSGAAFSNEQDLYGNYRFSKQVYMNPLSSFLALGGYEQYYTLGKDTLTITEETGEKQSVPITYVREEVSEQDFKASFDKVVSDLNINIPDITKYKRCCQYTLRDTSEHVPGYRLYILDDEIWLAKLRYIEELNGPNNECVWSIYGIEKYGGELPQPAEAAVTPAAYPEDTADAMPSSGNINLYAYIEGQYIGGVNIKSEDQIKIIEEAITAHKLSAEAWVASDVLHSDYHVRLSVQSVKEGNVGYDDYYIFDKDGRHCIQSGLYGMYSYLSDDAYNVIFGIAEVCYHSSQDAYQNEAPAETGPRRLPYYAEIELFIGGEAIHDIPIEDEAGKQLAEDVVMDYLMNSAAWEGVDTSTLENYMMLSGQFTVYGNGTGYYIFDKDGEHCMQSGDTGRYTILDNETYQSLLEIALGYNLPGAMTVVSGESSVKALESTIWMQLDNLNSHGVYLKPEQVADYLQYLSIDPTGDGLTPFTSYLDGEKVYGMYKLYDMNFNEITVVQPSGLEPQTYLFEFAKRPGRYIVEMQASIDRGGIKFGSQYFFGVILPEK